MQMNKQTKVPTKKPRSRPTKKPANDTKMVRVSSDFQQFLKEHKHPGRTEIQFADEVMSYYKAGHGEDSIDLKTFKETLNSFIEYNATVEMQNRYLLESLFFSDSAFGTDTEQQLTYIVGELKAHRQRTLIKMNVKNDKGEENAFIATWKEEIPEEEGGEMLLTWLKDKQKAVTADLFFNHKIQPYAIEKHDGLSKLFTEKEQTKIKERLIDAAAADEIEAEADRIIAEIDRKAVVQSYKRKISFYAEPLGGLSKFFTNEELAERENRLNVAAATGSIETEADRIISEIIKKQEKEDH